MSDTSANRLRDIPETCERLGHISRPSFHRLVNQGSLPIVKIGSRTFVTEQDISAFIENRRTASRSA